MVTLQILVLSFLVRVRVSQLVSIFQKWKMLFLFVSLVCRRGIETLKRCLYFFWGGVFSSFCPLFSVPYFWLSLSGCVMYLSNMNKK